MASRPSLTFRGAAQENPTVQAALHFNRNNKIRGIVLSGEHTFGLESIDMKPLSPEDSSIGLVIYESDTGQAHAGCANDDELPPSASATLSGRRSTQSAGGSSASLVGGGPTLRIGAFADHCFVTEEGGSQETIDEVEALYNAISLIYERDVQIRIELSVLVLELSSTTPCSQTQPAQQTLNNFGTQWPIQYPSLAPLAQNMQLLTGRAFSDQSTPIGMAHYNGICNNYAYSVNHVTHPFV